MKLHPLSVPYRSMQSALSVIPVIVFALFIAAGSIGEIPGIAWFLIVGGALLAIVTWQVAYYQRFEYELTADTFDIRSGVISRRNREIPLGRIQNVDISRNLLQRTLGVAVLQIETAGGSQTEAMLRYVGYDEAKRLQNALRDAADRRETGRRTEGTVADTRRERTEELVYEITPTELVVLAVASFDLRVASFVFVLLTIVGPSVVIELIADVPISPAIVIAFVIVVILLLSAVTSGARAIANTYGFRLTRSGDELRYERGLLQRYDGSIPTDKIQTLVIRENVLKRLFGYASLNVETAGYAPGQGTASASESAVPIARRERTTRIARTIEAFGDLTFERPPKRARYRYAIRYLAAVFVVIALAVGVGEFTEYDPYWPPLLAAIPLAPIAAHYKWKHRGYYTGEEYVLTRNGFWHRTIHVVPYYRVQTVIESRTYFQRRWRIGTVTIDTAGTSGLVNRNAQAVDVDEEVAVTFRETVADRLQTALIRRRRDREWHDEWAQPGLVDVGDESLDQPETTPEKSDEATPGKSDKITSEKSDENTSVEPREDDGNERSGTSRSEQGDANFDVIDPEAGSDDQPDDER